MMTLSQNKKKMYYSMQTGNFVPVYVWDNDGNRIIDYVDEEGNAYYRETGEKEMEYSEPVAFYGNIATGGESSAVEFGIDLSQYDAVLVMMKDEIPITETSLLWVDSEVGYKDADRTAINSHTADYKVLAIKSSLNQTKYILGHLTR